MTGRIISPNTAIVGPSGTGKTTLSQLLGACLQYPLYTLSLRYYPLRLTWETLSQKSASEREAYQYQAALWMQARQQELTEEWSQQPHLFLDRVGVSEVVLYAWYLAPDLQHSSAFQALLDWGNAWIHQNLDGLILLRYLDSYEEDPYRPAQDFRLMELYLSWTNGLTLPVLDLPAWPLDRRVEEALRFINEL